MRLPSILAATLLLLAAPALRAQGDGVTLMANVDQYSGYNDVWGYTAPNGDEYAILGTTNGIAVYNCTNPSAPYRTGFISANSSGWRDMRTYGTYCYSVTEGGGGLTIIDMSNPEAPFKAATYTGSFSDAHNIAIDTATGIAYIAGSDDDMPVLDLSNPTAPVEIANYRNQYVHDLHVQNGQAHLAEMFAGQYRIVDVTALPSFPSKDVIGTPNSFAHNVWPNANDTIAALSDEVGGTGVVLYDISNPNNIQQLTSYHPFTNGTIHNAFIEGDRVYAAWYSSGFACIDISNPSVPVFVGSYDTSSSSGNGFDGAWGCYPFTGNGMVYVSDMDNGLFVLRVDGQAMKITHTPLGNTTNEAGPYAVSAEIEALQSNTITSGTVSYQVDGGATQTVAMSNTVGDTWVGDIPGQAAPAIVTYWIDAQDDQGNSLREPGTGSHTFAVGVFQIHWSDDFESGANGWTHAIIPNGFSNQDDWQRGTPAGKSTDPSSAHSGSNVWANDIGASGWNGEYASNVHNYLESPSIDLSGKTETRLRFWRHLGVEKRNSTTNTYDTARLLVNGTQVWINPLASDVIDSGWTLVEYDISAIADNNPNTTIRFELESDGGLQYGGWTIDDIEIYSLTGNTNTIVLTGDTNGSVGSTVSYSISNAPASETWYLLWSLNTNGKVFGGHNFDLGDPVTIAHTGTTSAAGTASFTSAPLPPNAAGATIFLEAAAKSGSEWTESAVLALTVN